LHNALATFPAPTTDIVYRIIRKFFLKYTKLR
jgi:hypothetical protein